MHEHKQTRKKQKHKHKHKPADLSVTTAEQVTLSSTLMESRVGSGESPSHASKASIPHNAA